jgi:hypothetical protein
MSNVELEPFQVPAHKELVTQRRHLLLAKMGRGKTFVAVKAMYDIQAKSVLIVCPKNAILVWDTHIRFMLQGMDDDCGKDTEFALHWDRSKYNNTAKRQAMAKRRFPDCLNVWITTYDSFLRDKEIYGARRYDLVVIDEAKRIRSRKSKTYLALKPICKETGAVWPLTGSPGDTPDDLYTMLDLMDHRLFPSFHKFMNMYCYWQKLPWGGIEYLGLKNKEGWYEVLRRKVSFMHGSHMDNDPVKRQLIEVDLDDHQERVYREIDEDMMSFSGDNLIIAQTDMTKVLRFRQIMCCPKILDPTATIGAAFEHYTETITNDTDPHTVVFTPFTDAIPYFVDHLRANGHNNAEVLVGGLHPDELQRRIDRFRKSRGQIICSIKYATAFSLEPASECFFIGYEFDPEDNAQAEARLKRLTTKYGVTAFYYAYRNTYTQRHLEILTNKQQWNRQTLGTPKFDPKVPS